jgi:transposase
MKPYSNDLRRRIFNYSLTHSIRATARQYRVSPNTVFLLRQRFIDTGDLQPKTPVHSPSRAIAADAELHLQLWLAETPDLTLQALCDLHAEVYGRVVGLTTMHNTLQRLRLTRKRKTFRDPLRNTPQAALDKQDYDAQLATIPPQRRVYLDETGGCLNLTPAYGRSPRGQRAHDLRPTAPGVTVNTVALLSTQGIMLPHTYQGTLNARRFVGYLRTIVFPALGNEAVLIMDRHPVHQAKLTRQALTESGIRCLFLPAYSPELNPIEEAFAKLKHVIKQQKPRTVDTLLAAIKRGIQAITPADAMGYFAHAAEF